MAARAPSNLHCVTECDDDADCTEPFCCMDTGTCSSEFISNTLDVKLVCDRGPGGGRRGALEPIVPRLMLSPNKHVSYARTAAIRPECFGANHPSAVINIDGNL